MGLGITNEKYLFPQILQEYVNLVEDVDTKLNLAIKFKCHDVVIDVSSPEFPRFLGLRTLNYTLSGEWGIMIFYVLDHEIPPSVLTYWTK